MSETFPTQARVVVIGGGIVGCSTAYHLTKVGFKDVVLLERKTIASGTTWAAAGLVTQLRQNRQMTNLVKYATELYADLEAETGMGTGYVTTGAVALCQTQARRQEWLRSSAMAASYGIDVHEISIKEALDLVPGMSDTDLLSAFYIPKDGQTNPEDTAQSLAKGARMGGAQIFENTSVTDVLIENGVIKGVETEQGTISCEYVVNCAGMWGREVGKMAGVSIPLFAAEHMHAITLPIKGYKDVFPSVRDFDEYTYFKSEGGGLLLGGFEPVAKPWGRKGIPRNFKYTQLQEDWDQFEIFMDCAFKRFPDMENAQIRHLEVVPESFTPDTSFIIGEAPLVKNMFVACGMNSVGIASAAGVGRAVAQWMDQGYPEEELWPVDVRRYFPWQQNTSYVHDRAVESVGVLYHKHYPNRQKTTARDVIHSPIHDRLKERGACFSQIAGWERADWFAPEGVEPKHIYDWNRPNWFDYQKKEHMAVREGVGLYDLTSMGKYIVQGRDAEAALQHICSNDISGPMGKVTYTPILNERGGFESDVTVTRTGDNSYFIVTAAGTVIHDLDYITRNFPEDAHVTITDVTHGYAMLAVMGPDARKLLSEITDDDLSNKAFPYATAKEIDIAYARPLAIRMSYVGELGWEFYIPTNFAARVFDAIVEAGEKYKLQLVGMQAVNSLRMETGFRHWESDITPDETPYEAGLGFGVKLGKDNFIGKAALVKQKEEGLKQKLVMFTLDDSKPMLYTGEPIFRNDEWVGEISSGAYGFLVGSAVGMAYVAKPDGSLIDNAWIQEGTYTITVEGKKIPAKVHIKSPYDPDNQRLKM
jgi:4-methylaminobutanoate oxidase (formaldehyde-forming)